jgi:hypothetical protein
MQVTSFQILISINFNLLNTYIIELQVLDIIIIR